ncbi:MAG TPA: dTDP-4-dehydrorhamnose reductase [Bryobacteraceae bacterium]|nr:dTDP-4-dehydrorhamnose reductase [Bryobacteraceae bacterium]
MSKRAVVFGNLGQLGVELTAELVRRGYEVTGSDRTQIDITNREQVEHHLAAIDPQVVFNAAAHNQVDVAEEDPDAAFQVNALAVRNVALACRQVNARLVHYSTDYVFDGRAGRPYTEQDTPHPLGAYAVSKLAGELYAQAYLEAPLILRTSGVFGPGGLHTARGNFIELMLRLAAGGKPIRVVEDHIASPTYAPALAARSVDLVDRGETGLFHVGGGAPVSWFEFAKLIFKVAGLTPELRPTNEREYRTAARRPRFSALANARMDSLGLEPMPALDWCVKDYFARRDQYKAPSA